MGRDKHTVLPHRDHRAEPPVTVRAPAAPRARAAPPSMEVWSEKNIRFSLLAGVGLPIVGVVTPPDNALAATILPLAIAGIWIYIFVDLLKAATPEDA